MKHAFESFVPVGGVSLTLIPGDHEITSARLWVEMPVTIGGTRYEPGIHREFKTPLPSGEVTVLPMPGKIPETVPGEENPETRAREIPPRGGWVRLTGEIAPEAKPASPIPAPAAPQNENAETAGSAPEKTPDPVPTPKKKR